MDTDQTPATNSKPVAVYLKTYNFMSLSIRYHRRFLKSNETCSNFIKQYKFTL